MPKLTETVASRIVVPEGKRDVFKFDTGAGAVRGFFFRKFASGETVAGVRYTINGRRRQPTLGEVRANTVTAFRRLAAEVRAKARIGIDVMAEREASAKARKAAAEETKNAETLSGVIGDYLQARERGIGFKRPLRPRSLEEVRRHLRVHSKPLHARPLRGIKRSDIVELLDGIAEKSGPIAADRVHASLSTLLQWALDRGKIDAHPATGIKAYGEAKPARPLSERELGEVWRACGNDDYGRIVRLAILTALRRENLGSLEWSDVDLAAREIRIPGSKMKNRRDFVLPLPNQAVQLLRAIPRRGGRYVFGATVGKGFSGWSRAKEQLCQRIDAKRHKPMAPWRFHGLRQTFSTLMNNNGLAPPHIVDELLAHVGAHRQGVAGVYNQADYAKAKRDAMDAWGELVAELVG